MTIAKSPVEVIYAGKGIGHRLSHRHVPMETPKPDIFSYYS